MRSVAILGSTGSIGTQALDVIRQHPERFRVTALAAGRQVQLLAEQVREFRPVLVSVPSPVEAEALRALLAPGERPAILTGPEGLEAVATEPGAEILLTSVVGALGLQPTLAGIRAGKAIALANKETLVAAGELVMAEAARYGAPIIPVDSEHSALFQCLVGEEKAKVARLILTASGGPFRGRKDLSGIRKEQALKHPRWVMGAKVTIDSASLMNKALEMIEARWLFGLPMQQIDVLVHPQSIVHSLVEYVDGNQIAQLGPTDMRLPIQYALGYPERLESRVLPRLNLAQVGTLTFEEPDQETFPSLDFARWATEVGGTLPAVMNAANEVAVARFLADELSFGSIFRLVEAVMKQHDPSPALELATILDADGWARRMALAWRGA
ncbi:MAG TPA: 1-deoxy-D-xylulose-5-phosphate reductoisomerase [Symbiobacteriaceae bacterium]|nr:1-deoxy-D-xylulose-5-phosphate reductoisomerase [Symbiobacteriaceae bacterium]